MPVSPPERRLLNGLVTIRPIFPNSIPSSWVINDEIRITQDGEAWEMVFTDMTFVPTGWECVARYGPKLETGTTVSITFELSVAFTTTLERVEKTYTFVINNVPIDRTS